MKLEYRLYDPTGNVTVLVASPVPEAIQPAVAERLMALEPKAEQVGFLTEADGADIALRMAGGEFCGNAAMCAAVYAAEARGIERGAVTVRVSGAAEPVSAAVALQPDGSWRGVVDMPRPAAIERHMLPGVGEAPVVRFDGITHIVLTDPMPRPLAERQARVWCAALGAEALGLLFFDRRTERMTPLVFVPAAGTLCWENACASGTAAVGAYLAAREGGAADVTLRQPGGWLRIEAADGALRLTGSVRAGARRQAEIDN